jgi:hypothetical protein
MRERGRERERERERKKERKRDEREMLHPSRRRRSTPAAFGQRI